jgi:Deoxyribodipyrimidine photo-lyase type I (EC 4.1.99.3)
MTSLVLLWHRRDLRLGDNTALHGAAQRSPQVVPVFVFDPQLLQRADMAPARVAFLLQALQELQERYAQMGIPLLWRRGDPAVELRQLATELGRRPCFGTKIWIPGPGSRRVGCGPA